MVLLPTGPSAELTQYLDQMLVHLRDPAQFRRLFLTADDTVEQARAQLLFSAVYDLPHATLHEVRDVNVSKVEVQRPLFVNKRARAEWIQTTPAYMRSDFSFESRDAAEPLWLDVAADVGLDLLLELESSSVESITSREISGYATLDQFRAQFRFIDLDEFMSRRGISTVEELREDASYLISEIRLRAQQPFDVDDPTNIQRMRVNAAVLVRDVVDVGETLRAAKRLRALTSPRIVLSGRAFRN